MFSKPKIVLEASRRRFRFRSGTREQSFRPIVYVTADGRVASVGEPPPDNFPARAVAIFEADCENAVEVLEAMFRYGSQLVRGGFSFWQPRYEITVSSDLRDLLKGFTNPVFRHAATLAGADEVVVSSEALRPPEPGVGQTSI